MSKSEGFCCVCMSNTPGCPSWALSPQSCYSHTPNLCLPRQSTQKVASSHGKRRCCPLLGGPARWLALQQNDVQDFLVRLKHIAMSALITSAPSLPSSSSCLEDSSGRVKLRLCFNGRFEQVRPVSRAKDAGVGRRLCAVAISQAGQRRPWMGSNR
jgi:hypothetical protein